MKRATNLPDPYAIGSELQAWMGMPSHTKVVWQAYELLMRSSSPVWKTCLNLIPSERAEE